jgi:hypothetical protein
MSGSYEPSVVLEDVACWGYLGFMVRWPRLVAQEHASETDCLSAQQVKPQTTDQTPTPRRESWGSGCSDLVCSCSDTT